MSALTGAASFLVASSIRFFNFLSRSGGFLALVGITPAKSPQPVTKYCITMLMTFETSQYRDKPLGKVKQKKPNIKGIIHSIIRLCACILGSAAAVIDIFCCTHMVPPTRRAIVRLGTLKSSQRNLFDKGSVEYSTGQEYKYCERPRKSSGVTARTLMIA